MTIISVHKDFFAHCQNLLIRLTHNIMTAFNGGWYPATADKKVIVKATTLTVN
jgi:hypothetical protein